MKTKHNIRDPNPLGGIIHTYQGYDPKSFPPPTGRPPDMVSSAFEHLLMYGSMRRFTEEELARAVHLDPSQIKGLGPSIDALIAMLLERKRKILCTYETDRVQDTARRAYHDLAGQMQPPAHLRKRFEREVREEQIRDLEALWYRVGDEQSRFASRLLHLVERLGEKYQIDELAAKYDFTGTKPMTVSEALTIKQDLEAIDRLLKQLEEARETAQIGIIDLEALAEFAEPGDIQQLQALGQQIQDYLREMAERQGLEFTAEGYQLTPKAYRIFQSSLLQEIFSDLQAARSGRHVGPIIGEGAVELPRTKPYEFGDSPAHMDIPQSMINAMIRTGPGLPVRLGPQDIEIHHTRNTPKCATVVVMDMSGSMRYDGQYINAKRMALALDGLIRSEYPGDYLQIVEMYTFAKPRHISEVPALMPKPVTLYESVVRLRADMSDERITEFDIPQHFTNIQRGLQVARQLLTAQDTPNRQLILITDGLPTAHFEAEQLYLLYPPHPRTEEATMREAQLVAREGITINVFLLPNWGQTHEDVQFAHRMVEATGGRVFFTGGTDLDRYVVWDYVKRRRKIIG
ncbi:MAG: VWA domain-containing protein [Planctomycetota bacterium]|nr:VWA domain-containing protein [Planctomycetota bacterium]